jgi:hypothetical protein
MARIGSFRPSETVKRGCPLLSEEGWPRHKKNIRSSLLARTGWFLNRQLSRCIWKDVGWGTTPLRATKEVVIIFLLPQPPLLTEEGTPPIRLFRWPEIPKTSDATKTLWHCAAGVRGKSRVTLTGGIARCARSTPG